MDMSIRFPGIGIEFEYVIRTFRIYGMEISVYGILIAAGMLLGLAVMLLEARRAKENLNHCLMVFIWSVLGGAVGARLFYAAFSWKQFQGDYFELLRIDHGGMAIYGGIFGAVIIAGLYCYLRKVSFGRMADYAGIGLVMAQIVGRWGDFFNRESFGEYTDSIFRMQLPLASVRTSEVTSLMRENLITVDGVSYILAHPTFLYESVWCLVLLFTLLGFMRRKKFDGEIFMRYLAGYGLGRFFVEWLRTDKLLIPQVDVSVSLVISALLFFVFGITAEVERSMMKKREKLRRRRNEAYYEAEERMAAEADARDYLKDIESETRGETLDESGKISEEFLQETQTEGQIAEDVSEPMEKE